MKDRLLRPSISRGFKKLLKNDENLAKIRKIMKKKISEYLVDGKIEHI